MILCESVDAVTQLNCFDFGGFCRPRFVAGGGGGGGVTMHPRIHISRQSRKATHQPLVAIYSMCVLLVFSMAMKARFCFNFSGDTNNFYFHLKHIS